METSLTTIIDKVNNLMSYFIGLLDSNPATMITYLRAGEEDADAMPDAELPLFLPRVPETVAETSWSAHEWETSRPGSHLSGS